MTNCVMDKGVAMPSGGVLIDEELQAQLADDMARRAVRGMRAFLVMLAMLVLLAAWILVGPWWDAPFPERAVCAAVPLVFALMLLGMVRQGRRHSLAAARHAYPVGSRVEAWTDGERLHHSGAWGAGVSRLAAYSNIDVTDHHVILSSAVGTALSVPRRALAERDLEVLKEHFHRTRAAGGPDDQAEGGSEEAPRADGAPA